MMFELSMDDSIDDNVRPDSVFWLKKLHEKRPTFGRLIRLYLQSGLELEDAYWKAGELPDVEKYEEIFRLRNQLDLNEQGYAKPQPVHVVSAEYPYSMRFLQMEGKVVVSFVVRLDGSVSDISVESSPHPVFSESAVRALKQWKFLPGRNEDGQVVQTRIKIPIFFKFGN